MPAYSDVAKWLDAEHVYALSTGNAAYQQMVELGYSALGTNDLSQCQTFSQQGQQLAEQLNKPEWGLFFRHLPLRLRYVTPFAMDDPLPGAAVLQLFMEIQQPQYHLLPFAGAIHTLMIEHYTLTNPVAHGDNILEAVRYTERMLPITEYTYGRLLWCCLITQLYKNQTNQAIETARAIQRIEAETAKEPRFGSFYLGVCYFWGGLYESACRQFEALLGSETHSIVDFAEHWYAISLWQLGRQREAKQSFRVAEEKRRRWPLTDPIDTSARAIWAHQTRTANFKLVRLLQSGRDRSHGVGMVAMSVGCQLAIYALLLRMPWYHRWLYAGFAVVLDPDCKKSLITILSINLVIVLGLVMLLIAMLAPLWILAALVLAAGLLYRLKRGSIENILFAIMLGILVVELAFFVTLTGRFITIVGKERAKTAQLIHNLGYPAPLLEIFRNISAGRTDLRAFRFL